MISILKKIKTFWGFDIEQKWLISEAYLYLIFAFVLIRFVSFKNFKRIFIKEENSQLVRSRQEIAVLHKNVYSAVKIAAKHTHWESRCYEQAIAVKLIFNRLCISNILHLGVRKKEDKYDFHAWITSENQVIVGGGHLKKYTRLTSFSSKYVKEH